MGCRAGQWGLLWELARVLSSEAPSLVPSTCMEGVLQCQEVPSCPGPGVWGSWGPWEDCSVSCGGGEQLRSRRCARPPCPGPARQSRTCRTQVCRGEPRPGSALDGFPCWPLMLTHRCL